jgi:ATP-binding cassette subfamily B multidrug efflux pump
MFFKNLDYLPEGGMKPIPDRLWPFIWYFVRQMKGQFSAILVVFALSALILAMIPYFMQVFVEGLGQVDDRSQIWSELYWPLVLFVSLVLVIQPILAQAGNYIQAKTLPPFSNMIRRQLALYMHRHSYSYYQDDFAGRLAGKVVEMPMAMAEIMYAILGAVLYAVIVFIISIFLYISVGPIFGVIACSWLLIYIGKIIYFVPKIQKSSKKGSDERSHLRGRFVDIITNILTVKLFARSKYEDAYLGESLWKTSNAFIKNNLDIWNFWVALEFLTTAVWIATLVATILGWQNGSVSTAQFAMILPLTLQVTQTSWWISEIFTSFFQRLGEVQEGMDAIIQDQDVLDKKDAPPLALKKGVIHFENVCFSYGNKNIFEDLNVKIKQGEKVGLIGASGAGKSTFIQLLLRLYDIDSGHIKIDEQIIADVTQKSLRENISVIPQISDLLHRSVKENILYGRLDASDKDVELAAQKAHADEFILELKDKHGNTDYDALVGERGVRLSGGQRQRVAIARAILKNAPILVLDEATSALDSESERLIQKSMLALMKDKTVIAVAHRLSTIAYLDRLLVMEDGKIIENGSHDELITQNGYYAKLWRMQSGGFLKLSS